MKNKMYKFSAKKHAHDIELVSNRCYNLAHDALDKNDFEEYESLIKKHHEADEVLLAIQDGMQGWTGITLLTGPMIGKAKEMVILADEIRCGLNLQYK